VTGPLIYHIATTEEWESGRRDGEYTPAAFETDGFIHLSTHNQIVDTANRYYGGRRNLVLLCVDPDAVTAPLRYEDLAGSGQRFPHLYGRLSLEAVVEVLAFPCEPDGSFSMPGGLS